MHHHCIPAKIDKSRPRVFRLFPADRLRQALAAAGWTMLDGKDGYKLEPVKK